jgi:hypothetical protein
LEDFKMMPLGHAVRLGLITTTFVLLATAVVEGKSVKKPLTVGVDSFGNHQAGNAEVTIEHPSTGKYIVTFADLHLLSARGTIECATVATLSRGMSGAFNSGLFNAPSGQIGTFPGFTDPAVADQVVVNTYDSAGNPSDQSFWLVLFCDRK